MKISHAFHERDDSGHASLRIVFADGPEAFVDGESIGKWLRLRRCNAIPLGDGWRSLVSWRHRGRRWLGMTSNKDIVKLARRFLRAVRDGEPPGRLV